jgi:hypothetical protein
MEDKQPVSDQILDLLLEALAERQREREGVGQSPAKKELTAVLSPVEFPEKQSLPQTTAEKDGRLEEKTVVVADQPWPDEDQLPAFNEEVNIDSFESALDAGDEEQEVLDEFEDDLLPEPLPVVGLGRMLGRLAFILFLLLVIVNIPFNRFGTSLARAMPDEAALIIRDGLVLKGSGERIYVLEDNQLRWISSLEAFEYFGYRWEQVRQVDDAFLADFEEGRPVHVLLKCRTSPHVYALEDGRKRWIKDIPTFEAEGYVWEDVMEASCSYLQDLPDGVPIPADAGPVPQP